VQSVGSGLASFDYDGDGLVDIYFLNGRPLRGNPSKEPARNALYRNLGASVVDVTDRAGVETPATAWACVWATTTTTGGPTCTSKPANVLYRNRGDGPSRMSPRPPAWARGRRRREGRTS
jgi:hypothetical protein